MKKTFFLLLAAALTVSAAQAQDIPERKHDGAGRSENMKKRGGDDMAKLNLTEDQKKQFKSLQEQRRKDMEALKTQNLSPEQSKEKMEALRKDYRDKSQALLTPEQKTQMESFRKDRKEGMTKRGEFKGKERKKDGKWGQDLNLTPEQSEKLAASRKATGDQLKAVKDNQSLSEDAKKAERKKIMKAQQESMKSILTPEQQQKMKESRKKHGDRKKKRTEAPVQPQ
jgi:Spy/CpxP family protein refolding chaperone